MKKNKATGPDGIPAEVWQQSDVANNELYFFLRHVWEQECVPRSLVLCVFIMVYKRKGSRDDPDKYRALGLLNHAYKILSVHVMGMHVLRSQLSPDTVGRRRPALRLRRFPMRVPAAGEKSFFLTQITYFFVISDPILSPLQTR